MSIYPLQQSFANQLCGVRSEAMSRLVLSVCACWACIPISSLKMYAARRVTYETSITLSVWLIRATVLVLLHLSLTCAEWSESTYALQQKLFIHVDWRFKVGSILIARLTALYRFHYLRDEPWSTVPYTEHQMWASHTMLNLYRISKGFFQ